MALERYRAKRDFTKSPEPSGDRLAPGEAARSSSASRSTSPAISITTSASSTTACSCRGRYRRGRRSIPSIKRFATQVEDHPFDYGEFEGVIPEGYGAGIVMLWDKGTWEPEVARRRRGAEEGRPQVPAERLQAERLVGAGADARAAPAATAATGC